VVYQCTAAYVISTLYAVVHPSVCLVKLIRRLRRVGVHKHQPGCCTGHWPVLYDQNSESTDWRKICQLILWTYFTLRRCSRQGDHLPVKPGKVRQCESDYGKARANGKSQGKVLLKL